MSALQLPYSLDASVGAAYLGTIAAAIFYGITNIQIFIYSRNCKEDSLVLKASIFFLLFIQSLHLAFIVHAVYTYTVTDFGNPFKLIHPVWSITAQVIVSSIGDAIVRGLFCQRIWRLSERNIIMATAIALSSFAVFGSGFAFAIWGFIAGDYFFELRQLSYFLYTNFASGAVADTLIATSLCILLARRRTDFAWTRSLIRSLMLYSINTGLLTSVCAILCFLMYTLLSDFDKFAFIAIYFVLPNLLLNSLLASLNARPYLREQTQTALASVLTHGAPSVRTRPYARSDWSQPSGDRETISTQVASPIEMEIRSMYSMVDDEIGQWKPSPSALRWAKGADTMSM